MWALAAGSSLVLGAAGGIDVARFFTVFAIMLLAGKFAGEAFERLGQPAVMGELLAGIALGAGFLKVIPIGAADPLTPVLAGRRRRWGSRSEEHTSELQSYQISYA